MLFIAAVVSLVTDVPVCMAGTAGPSPTKFEHLAETFNSEANAGIIPGAIVLIEQHGQPVYFKCFGVRDAATKTPMTPDTLFALHSMTKPITSVAAMMLIDDGKLSLDDPVASYIPAFAAMKVGVDAVAADGKPVLKLVPANRPVTIRDLLRHTSGITYEYIGSDLITTAYTDANLFTGNFDNKVFAERIAGLPLSSQPGTLWRYGHSTDILGRVIEVVSGKSLFEFERARIFEPLGMMDTSYGIATAADRARMAKPMPDDSELRDSEQARLAHPQWQSGGGGLVSTAADYARFSQMILHRGELDGKRYLSPKSYEQMTTDQIGSGSGVARDDDYFPGAAFGFGFGFAVRIDTGKTEPPERGAVGNLEWDSGSGPAFVVDPEHDIVAVMMVQVGAKRGQVQHAFKKLVYEALQK
ncbi:MAG: beta-lactamase family protein [Rhizobiales bacterium]|nr:beta-lactamase family protein [Hyphomicrobiales bacterium]